MRVSRLWLGDFVDLQDIAPERVAELLTLSGTEVERTLDYGQGLDQVVVGEVVELGRVAGSDHLFLALVSGGSGEPVEVVCGAGNLFVGALVPWARPGSQLPSGLEIGRRKIRGVLSHGMLCAPDELGLGTDHEGILILPPGEAAAGLPLSELFAKDTVYELEILSNRADCLSHWGVARELAAVLDRPLRDPDLRPVARSGRPLSDELTVAIEDEGLCPIYQAEGFSGIPDRAAPLWMQARLQAVGQRSVSGIVDVANYVLLDVGQPLHTFDRERLDGGGAVNLGVRRARPGERLLCLDGVDRELDSATLLITAGGRPAAIAGVIGGQGSAVHRGTRELVLEAASFAWTSIRGTSRRLGLRTEASARFERLLAPQLAAVGARRFARLLTETIGGELRPGPVEAGRMPEPVGPIPVSPARISSLLGLELSPEQASQALRRLQFTVNQQGQQLAVTPPPVRTDVRQPVDLVEEVGRIIGYQEVPGTIPAMRVAPPAGAAVTPAASLAAELLMGAGFTECITGSLLPADRVVPVPGLGEGRPDIRLANPLSTQLGTLRPSLLPGLLNSCLLNQSRGRDRVRLFEQGRVFWPAGGDRPEEPELLALVDQGLDLGPEASAERLFHVLRVCQALGDRLGPGSTELRPAAHPGFHPLRCAEVWSGGQLRGLVGELLAAAAEQLELRGRVVAAELRTDGWLVAGGRPSHPPFLARTPALLLDLAVMVAERALLGAALGAVRAADIPWLEEIWLRDQYQGSQVPPGRKGWTFRLRLRHPERTLTSRDGELARDQVLVALRESVAAELR